MPEPFHVSGAVVDLASRIFQDKTVDASPAAADETVIATLTMPDDLAVGEGVMLFGWCTLTVGTSGTAITARLRRDSVAGTVIAASGATTATAAQLVDRTIMGFDTAPSFPNEVYVLTLQVTAGAAVSTVSAVTLLGIVI